MIIINVHSIVFHTYQKLESKIKYLKLSFKLSVPYSSKVFLTIRQPNIRIFNFGL